MALYMNQFNQITVAAGGLVYHNWTYQGAVDTGPNYVSAYFIGAPNNFGTMTTVQTSINSFETEQYGYYWPMGFSFSSVMRNDSNSPVGPITINIGNFQ